MNEITPEISPDKALVPPLDPTFLKLSDEETEFLHSAISDDDEKLRVRIMKVQSESYEAYPYPCIRAYHFVWLMMLKNMTYSKILEAGKKGDTVLLDLGCCMGTDVRKLVHDGYPARNILGCDLRQEFIDHGYELYQDRDTCQIQFFSDDIFKSPASTTREYVPSIPLAQIMELGQLQNRLTHLYTGALFHLFDEKTQRAIAVRLGVLLKRSPGAVVFGRHQGKEKEGLIDDHLGRVRYGHSPTSWALLWKQVFTELEGEEFAENHIKVDAELRGSMTNLNNPKNDTRFLFWSVSIV